MLVGRRDRWLWSHVHLVVLFPGRRPKLLHPQITLHKSLLLNIHICDRVGMLRYLIV